MPRQPRARARERLLTRGVPGRPEGYYSGDQPNHNPRAFVEAHNLEQGVSVPERERSLTGPGRWVKPVSLTRSISPNGESGALVKPTTRVLNDRVAFTSR